MSSSLRLWLPCRVSPMDRCDPRRLRPEHEALPLTTGLAPSEVSSPIAFSQSGGAPSQGSTHAALLEHGCALRVSHPLDALLPPRPAGLVPSRSHVWGSPFEALLRGERRARLSSRLDPHEVSSLLVWRTRERARLASELRLSRALLTPRRQPPPAGVSPRYDAVASMGFSPSRRTQLRPSG